MQYGRRLWFIPDGYLPAAGKGERYEGHEAICVLNTGAEKANLRISLYFADREPAEDIPVVVNPKRSLHIRLDRAGDLGGFVVPRDVPYGMKVESDVNVVVQYSRLDVTQPNYTLMTTVPYFE
jgi:hypothetical protein